MIERQPRLALALAIATLAGGLAIDRAFALPGQLAASVWVWWAMFALLRGLAPLTCARFWLCLIIATAGEVFLSLGWGLYRYQFGNIPLFVPPGHALVYVLGLFAAPYVSRTLVWLVPVAFAPYVLYAAVSGVDTLSLPMFAILLACIAFGKSKQLYAAMFLIALLLELYGTWVGNWRWVSREPWFGLSATNPPAAVGALYCALDALVALALSGVRRFNLARQPWPSATEAFQTPSQ